MTSGKRCRRNSVATRPKAKRMETTKAKAREESLRTGQGSGCFEFKIMEDHG